MITIIHGDSIEESRENFFQVKTKLENLVSLEGQTVTKDSLVNFFSGKNLFFEEKNLSIENLLSKNKIDSNLDELVGLINENEGKSNIIIWEEKEISPKVLSLFPKAQIQTFKIPKLIFNFLDGIKPGNGQSLIILFHKLLENTSVEIILFMIVRQIRLLLAVSFKNKSDGIDELNKIAPWQRGKMERQASLFKIGQLVDLYSKIYELDLSQKTGTLSMPLVNAIDFLLLDI